MYEKLVPSHVEEMNFFSRYFYLLQKIQAEDQRRAKLLSLQQQQSNTANDDFAGDDVTSPTAKDADTDVKTDLKEEADNQIDSGSKQSTTNEDAANVPATLPP